MSININELNASNVVASETIVNGYAAEIALETVSDVKTNQSTYGVIEQLASERKAWQEGAFYTSNEQLYEILKNCYKLYKDMCGDNVSANQLRETLANYITENKVSVKLSAHTMTKIVRCVFGNDRRRVSAYSIVLRAALVANIQADALSDYIRKNGGVEEVRLAKSPNYVSPKSKAELASNWLSDVNLAVIKSEELANKLDAANVGSQHVLIVTQNAQGELIANAFVSNQSVVTNALAAYYSANKSQKDIEKIADEISNAEDTLSEAIKEAAQKAA